MNQSNGNSEFSSLNPDTAKSESRTVWRVVGYLWIIVVLILLLGAFGVFAISKGWLGMLPRVEDIANPINKYASRIYSDDGELIGTYSVADDNRIIVPYDSLPDNLVKALVATEDERFYEHSGIDMRAFMRALIKRVIMGQKSAGGGSTITQQLAKLLFTRNAVATEATKRAMQKPIEWFVAVQLEYYYTKEEILAMYLNQFDFLYNAVGIKNAAKTYFGKNPLDLSLVECATLVGMCKNPSYYNPRRFPERSTERRNVVLSQMHRAGYLTDEEFDAAKAEPLNTDRFHVSDHKDGLAPYFREYLRRIMMANRPDPTNYASWQAAQYYDDSLAWEVNPLYGWCHKNKNKNGNDYNIYTDGLKIYTSIDSRLQKYAEQALYDHVALYLQPAFNAEKKNSPTAPYSDLTPAEVKKLLTRAMRQSERYITMKRAGYSEDEIEQVFNTKIPMTLFDYQRGEYTAEMTPLDSIRYYKHFLRSAMMAMDPNSGKVRAYVGGTNFKYFQYDVILGGGRRQIGSTMKPFLYSLAMDNGYTPCDVAPNVQATYGSGPTAWTPRNASHARYGEMVTFKWGLSQSNNWIAAYVMSLLNVNQLVSTLGKFGINTTGIYPSMPLCLGPCDVSVGEMVSAYTTFATGGVRYSPLLVTRVEDADGNEVAVFTPRMNEPISREATYKMVDMLRAVIDYGTGQSLRRHGITADMLGKTGTTNSNADAWFMGVVPNLVVGCWVGGEDRDIHFNSMAMGQGARAALPIYEKFIKKVYENASAFGITQRDSFDIPADFQTCSNGDLDHLQWAEGFDANETSGIDSDFR